MASLLVSTFISPSEPFYQNVRCDLEFKTMKEFISPSEEMVYVGFMILEFILAGVWLILACYKFKVFK